LALIAHHIMPVIASWNVNGLRSLGLSALLDSLDADIVCLQETKLTASTCRALLQQEGDMQRHVAFFAHSIVKAGYSGTATICKTNIMPLRAWDSIKECANEFGNDVVLGDLDKEGRAVITDHGKFMLFNLYVPNAASHDRLYAQVKFLVALEILWRMLIKLGKEIVVTGDINCAIREIDHCDPKRSIKDHIELVEDWDRHKDEFCKNSSRIDLISYEIMEQCVQTLKNSKNSIRFGDFPVRKWLSSILWSAENDSKGLLIDCFREFNADVQGAFTCWNTRINAREGNYGTRIDYILISKNLKNFIVSCSHLSAHKGSDHCPVICSLNVECETTDKVPKLCSLWILNELKKQKKISSFFSVVDKSSVSNPEMNSSNSLQSTKSSSKDQKGSKQISKPSGLENFGFTKIVRDSKKNSKESIDCVEFVSAESMSITDTPIDIKKHEQAKDSWRSIFKYSQEFPKCFHGEESVKKSVTKRGPNQGKEFFVCKYPTHVHHTAVDSNAESSKYISGVSCNFFQWLNQKDKS
jgi:AP endonuclease 2